MGSDTVVCCSAVPLFQRRARALPEPALLAEAGGHLPRLPWDWFQFPNAKTCLPARRGSGRHPGLSVQAGSTSQRRQDLASSYFLGSSGHPLLYCRDPGPDQKRMSYTGSHSWLKPSKDLQSEFSDSQSNDFSAHCAIKMLPHGGPLGIMCAVFIPEVRGTLPCLHFKKNPLLSLTEMFG